VPFPPRSGKLNYAFVVRAGRCIALGNVPIFISTSRQLFAPPGSHLHASFGFISTISMLTFPRLLSPPFNKLIVTAVALLQLLNL